MEDEIKLAAKMYECRDVSKRLLGSKYHERMIEYGSMVKNFAAAKKCGHLKAATMLADGAGGGMAAIFIMASFVEMTEPSNVAHHRQQKVERRRSAAFCCPRACVCSALFFPACPLITPTNCFLVILSWPNVSAPNDIFYRCERISKPRTNDCEVLVWWCRL